MSGLCGCCRAKATANNIHGNSADTLTHFSSLRRSLLRKLRRVKLNAGECPIVGLTPAATSTWPPCSSAVPGASGRPLTGGWVVELGAGGDRNNAGIADIDDAASHQNQAIRQQCRGLSQAGRRHAAGGRPSAGTRVVQLGAAEKARCAFASRNQHLAVREQRCALRTGKPLCRFLRYYKSIKFRRSVCHQTLNGLSRNVHIDGGVLEFWGTTTSIDRHEFTEVTKVSMWLSLPCHFLEDKQAVEKANCNRHGERQLGCCKPRLSKPVEFLNLRPKAACCRTLSETD